MHNSKMKQAMKELYRFNFGLSPLHKILGIDFSRCFEYSFAVSALGKYSGKEILDIGATATSFFPLFLAKHGGNVTVIDIDKKVHSLRAMSKKLGVAPKVLTKVVDARNNGLPSSHFDFVTCISTIEHIPDDGDILTMKEIARVIKPGGYVILSVPYGKNHTEGVWGRWFFRTYNQNALKNRLISTTDLNLSDMRYFGGKNLKRFSNFIYGLPRPIRFITQWTHLFFANYLLTIADADEHDAGMVCVVLRK